MYGYAKKVQEGARILDVLRPDWELEVIPDRIEMDSAAYCVLGQVFGSYHSSKTRPLREELYAKYGRNATPFHVGNGVAVKLMGQVPWTLLDREWKRLLKRRNIDPVAARERLLQEF